MALNFIVHEAPAAVTVDPSDPIGQFSSREVFSLPGNVIVLNLRIPVEQGFKITLQDGGILHVNFLPPVELRLLPSSSPDYVYEAHISCPWMKFKQLHKVGAILDSKWNKDVPLEDNIEIILHDLVLELPEKLKLQEVNLEWRATSRNFEASANLALDVPVESRRRTPVSRKPRNVIVKIKTLFRKSDDIGPILRDYDERERASSIPGAALVACPVGTMCIGLVLPTRAFKSSQCADTHLICYKCLVAMLKVAGCLPKCIDYECMHEYPAHELSRLVKGLPLHHKLLGFANTQSISETINNHCRKICPWCNCKGFPEHYVNTYNITLCKVCNRCYCQFCLSLDQMDRERGHMCDVMRGKELFTAQETDPLRFEELLDGYSNEYLADIKEAWFNQYQRVHDEQCCPRCFSGVSKTEGCNHMTCPGCSEHFCYVCGVSIPSKNPYSHFDMEGNCTNTDYFR